MRAPYIVDVGCKFLVILYILWDKKTTNIQTVTYHIYRSDAGFIEGLREGHRGPSGPGVGGVPTPCRVYQRRPTWVRDVQFTVF